MLISENSWIPSKNENYQYESVEYDQFKQIEIFRYDPLPEEKHERVHVGNISIHPDKINIARRNGIPQPHDWKVFSNTEDAKAWVEASAAIPPAAWMGMTTLNPGEKNTIVGFAIMKNPSIGLPIRCSKGMPIWNKILLANGTALKRLKNKWFSLHPIPTEKGEALHRRGINRLDEAISTALDITCAHTKLHFQSSIASMEEEILHKMSRHSIYLTSALPFRTR